MSQMGKRRKKHEPAAAGSDEDQEPAQKVQEVCLHRIVTEAVTADVDVNIPEWDYTLLCSDLCGRDGASVVKEYTLHELVELARAHARTAVDLSVDTRRLMFEDNHLASYLGKHKGWFRIVSRHRKIVRLGFWAAHPLDADYVFGQKLLPGGRACVRHAHSICARVQKLLGNEFHVVYEVWDFSRFIPTGDGGHLTFSQFQVTFSFDLASG